MPGGDTASSGQGATDGGRDVAESSDHVLVLANSMDGAGDVYCAERISSPAGTGSAALLVALEDPSDRRFDAVVRRGPGQPTDVGIICCDHTRSAAATQPTQPIQGPADSSGPWITTVASPGDLTGLGVRIEAALSEWEIRPDPIELCFHSLTTLCRYVDERAAFRFCHAVTRHLRSVGARSHFHLDPTAVDEQTVAMLSPLFDRVEDHT